MFENFLTAILGFGYAGGSILNESLTPSRLHQYYEKHGYNIERQEFLVLKAGSRHQSGRDTFEKILGHPYEVGQATKYIKEIAEREGWVYCDKNQMHNDPEYRRIVGIKKR